LHPQVKFYRCDFKICGLTATKIAKIGNFWYIFAQKGYIPFSNFYKIWHGERTHNHAVKTRMIGLPYGEKNYDDMLSRFHVVLELNIWTVGRTDRQICYITIAREYADAR